MLLLTLLPAESVGEPSDREKVCATLVASSWGTTTARGVDRPCSDSALAYASWRSEEMAARTLLFCVGVC